MGFFHQELLLNSALLQLPLKSRPTVSKNFELESLEPLLLLSGDRVLGAFAADELLNQDEPLEAIFVSEETEGVG